MKGKRIKLKVSPRQFEKMKIMYAIGLALNHHGLRPKDIFENSLNPDWIRLKDTLKGHWDNGVWLQPWQAEALEETGKCEFGLFKIRKTKKGYIVQAGIELMVRE